MKKSPAWAATIQAILDQEDWAGPATLAEATGLSYMTCLRLLKGEVPRWHHIERLAEAAKRTEGEVVALYELYRDDTLTAELERLEQEEQAERQPGRNEFDYING